jgi:excisionase family DNA binding protein
VEEISEVNIGTEKRKPAAWIPRQVINQASGLLPMLYTVQEIADELGVPNRTLRNWLAHGAPHRKVGKNRIWIHGQEFAEWIDRQRKPKRKVRLEQGQAYCMRYNRVVELSNPIAKPIKGKLIHVKGRCPHCGITINRGARLD